MPERILFLTGKLAEPRLRKVLESMRPTQFSYEVRNIGLSVAALMTAGMILRRVTDINGAGRVIVPGLCRGNLEQASKSLGVPVIRGPDDLKDLPEFFGGTGRPPDLSRYEVRIFAEIVEAPAITTQAILDRARVYAADGADVIDIGCLPDTPFPHLEESIVALKSAGLAVSVDSVEPDELLRAGRAGADYVLSLSEKTVWIAEEIGATPILIPAEHGDMESLYRGIEDLKGKNRRFLADSILDPIHFGFADSIRRYIALRERCPDIEIMMGLGNLTELTEADTTGVNAVLFGIISELCIGNILTTEVSPHARSAVREADRARRILFAAREDGRLPKGLDSGLLIGHARKPFPYSDAEIAELALEIRDPSYRVQVTETGIHVYNRDGRITGTDPFSFFPKLALLAGDAPHAFYMGVELTKARIAWQLGKRYVQDEELDWGVAVPEQKKGRSGALHAPAGAEEGYKPAGPTLKASRASKKKKRRKK